jgi:hypothetical protein
LKNGRLRRSLLPAGGTSIKVSFVTVTKPPSSAARTSLKSFPREIRLANYIPCGVGARHGEQIRQLIDPMAE